ncbi:uncharacterized protein EDB91DRAFT_1239803 [Suillus paluster]|uniref:uncharacterized protein n=1 Tax=Suillus paluster TaxID=48578 RepID=UPI001B87FC9E|nr:uncharacterized protein EDB91DRAFT_1239803 [Suillus paluster]KAG1725585.1 hypothetical protein EDB91DRAFT_1239803 [Suillus paluster]
MSLLQGVLKSQSYSHDLNGLSLSSRQSQAENDSDDELVGVFSLPGTPARSRAPSRPSSRPVSPTRRGPVRLGSGLTSKGLSNDPLKAFPTQVSQNIFRWLEISELATCARVSRKWNKSQTLNYIWFQHYRKENFHDDSLPPGKWTRRESKQNWREGSGRTSPSLSGYQTPKELKEEQWRQEELTQTRPGKVEMREMYKELGGRKSRTKTKLGGSGGYRDRTGWGEGDDD